MLSKALELQIAVVEVDPGSNGDPVRCVCCKDGIDGKAYTLKFQAGSQCTIGVFDENFCNECANIVRETLEKKGVLPVGDNNRGR